MKALTTAALSLGIATLALSQKPVIPSGWGEIASHSPHISFYLPNGWQWADLTQGNSSPLGSMTLIIQAKGAKMPSAPKVRDSVMVTGTSPMTTPVDDTGLKSFVDSLHAVLPNGTVSEQAIVTIGTVKAYMVHMKMPVQGDPEHPRSAEQYTYAIPGKRFQYRVVYTFISGARGFEDLQKQSIATFRATD